MLLWANSRFSGPIVFAKNCMFSLGTAVAPLITNFFLVPLPRFNESSTVLTFDNYTTSVANLTPSIDRETNAVCHYTLRSSNVIVNVTNQDAIQDVQIVRYAFVVCGIVYFVSGIIYVLVCICHKLTLSLRRIRNISQVKSLNSCSLSNRLRQAMKLSMYMVLLFFNGTLLMNIVQLFSTFMQCDLGWSVDQTARLMTVFYSTLLVGRLMSIPLSFYIKPETILLANLIAQTLGITMLLLTYNSFVGSVLLWTGIGCIGLGISTVIGNVFVWLAKSETLSGMLSALLMLSFYTGVIIGPTLSGISVDYIGYVFFIYSILVGIAAQWAGFLGALVLTQIIIKHQGSIDTDHYQASRQY